jgi:hypothetical protein
MSSGRLQLFSESAVIFAISDSPYEVRVIDLAGLEKLKKADS